MVPDPESNSSDQEDRRRPGFAMVVGIALGAIIGVPLGMAMHSLPVGIGIGSLWGLMFGIAFEPRKAVRSPTGWELGLVLVVAGLAAFAGIWFFVSWGPSP